MTDKDLSPEVLRHHSLRESRGLNRDPELLAGLRERALTPLVGMARWQSEGHAMPAFLILGRIAGLSDDAVRDLWNRGERETVIEAAQNRP